MKTDRPNRIPQPGTIARYFASGRYCDYPADIVLSAVNTCDCKYDSVTIPVRLGFIQMFNANIRTFAYLCKNRDTINAVEFLADPDRIMEKAGVTPSVPFDGYLHRIFMALLEDEMFTALHDPEGNGVFDVVYSRKSDSWRYRHQERYPSAYMKRNPLHWLEGIPAILSDKEYEVGLNKHMGINLLFIRDFFTEK